MHAGPDSFPCVAWECHVDPVRSSMRGGSPDQVDELEPAGDLGGVGVVVVGDQELDRCPRPALSAPSTCQALGLHRDLEGRRPCLPAGEPLLGPSATNQSVLPWNALSSSSVAVTTRKPFQAGTYSIDVSWEATPSRSPGSKAKSGVSSSSASGGGRGDVGREGADLVVGLAQADHQLAAGLPSARRPRESSGPRSSARPPPWCPVPRPSRAGFERAAMCQRRPRRRRWPGVGPPLVPG